MALGAAPEAGTADTLVAENMENAMTSQELNKIADILSSYSVSSSGLDHYVAQLRALAETPPMVTVPRSEAEGSVGRQIQEHWARLREAYVFTDGSWAHRDDVIRKLDALIGYEGDQPHGGQ